MADYSSLLSALSGGQRDAASAVLALFDQYGLSSLASKVIDFAKQGFSGDTMSVMLQETPEFKQRFSANSVRVKNGLTALSPAEYLATERSYRQIMSAAGMPSGFYDQPSDFQSFLEQDIAPQEVQQRVKDAQDFVNSVPAQVKQQFAQWYTTGDMVAFALDPQRATTAIERAYSAANVAGRAAGYGMSIDKATAEQIGGQGLTNDQIAQGVSNIALEASTAQKLAQMQGTTLTASDLAAETFLGNADVAKKRKDLASAERARFGASTGAGSSSLSRSVSGQL